MSLMGDPRSWLRLLSGNVAGRLLAVLFLSGEVSVALAADGVIGIGEANVAATGGYPYVISAPGSYSLTSNLTVSDLDTDAIHITADHVTLDLNGFLVSGPAVCSGSPGSISCSAGSGRGIVSTNANVSVVEGGVSGFAAGGVLLGDGSRIAKLKVESNGGAGVQVGAVSRVEESLILLNAGDGIIAGSGSSIFGNSASFNDAFGLDLGLGSGFADNILNQNGMGAVQGGGVDLDGNLCDGGPCIICTPVSEVCDGLDNDCDGQIDEDFPTLGAACFVGTGECLAGGVEVCTGDFLSTECSASAGSPSSEVCDGIDNDCDETPDNNLTDGGPCTNQLGVCSGSTQSCSGSAGYLACGPAEYGPDYEVNEVTCDGLDNDCDGTPDNNLTPPLCALQNGVCAGARQSCAGAAGFQVCGAGEYGPFYQEIETTCDSLDNDCNGIVDDGFQTGGIYDRDIACGNCLTDCTAIFSVPNGYGICDASGAPSCILQCCTIGDGNPACDGVNDYFDLNGIPSDGCEFAVDDLAIHVSDVSGSDDVGCGLSLFLPCASISFGISRAQLEARTRVLVASGAYTESVELVDGIDVHGGYHPVEWTADPSLNPTVIYGTGGALHRSAVSANDITSTTVFDGFTVFGAASGVSSGMNSYAVYIRDSNSNLEIRDNRIFAGRGGNGTATIDGLSGDSGAPGSDGLDGIETLGSCMVAHEKPGGFAGVSLCEAANQSGGRGGDSLCPVFETQNGDGSGGFGSGGGAPGSGGYHAKLDFIVSSCTCLLPAGGLDAGDGSPGVSGSDGAGGTGATDPSGSVIAGHWSGQAGDAGANGEPGSGGGGGGAGGGGELASGSCADGDRVGGSGGGGGGGGCGGFLGLGGGAGGGAFGIFVTYTLPAVSIPVVANNEIFNGIGGSGGAGADGSAGGSGGTGGVGGSAPSAFCQAAGGSGGAGGDGGHGGGGGGGAGGASYGIYVFQNGGTVDLTSYTTGNMFSGGGAGGGGGASLGSPGTPGVTGTVADRNF